MHYCCCAPFERFALVKASGYERIALPGSFLADCDEAAFARICAAVETQGLVCRSLNAFCPPEIKLVGPEHNPTLLAQYAHRLAARAARIGVEYVGVGSPNSRILPDGFDRGIAAEQWETTLRILCDAFGERKLSVLAEPLCTLECNWMNSTDEVREVVERLALPNLGMVFDMYHAFAASENTEPLRRALPYVKVVHIAQLVDGKKHYLRADHAADCADYFRVLREAGYDGEIAVEATYDPVEEALPRSATLLRAWSGEG